MGIRVSWRQLPDDGWWRLSSECDATEWCLCWGSWTPPSICWTVPDCCARPLLREGLVAELTHTGHLSCCWTVSRGFEVEIGWFCSVHCQRHDTFPWPWSSNYYDLTCFMTKCWFSTYRVIHRIRNQIPTSAHWEFSLCKKRPEIPQFSSLIRQSPHFYLQYWVGWHIRYYYDIRWKM